MSYQGRITGAFPAANPKITEFDGEWHDPSRAGDDPSVRDVLWEEHRGHLTAVQVVGLVAAVTALGWVLPLLG